MGSEEFAKKVAELTGGTVVDGKKHDKDDDHGVLLDISNGLGAIFWVGQFLKDEKSPEWVAGYMQAEMKKQKDDVFDREQFTDWERAKKNLRIMLLHRNREPEVFRSATEYGYNDLVLVPYVKVEFKDSRNGNYKVKSQMLNLWGVNPRNCIDIAIENSREDWEIHSPNELTAHLGILPPAELYPDVPTMLVVSNKDRYLGAVAEIFAREELVKRLGTGYTAIPSSRHEMIVLNRRQSDYEELNRMVREVNACELDGRDRLSDHVYEIW